MKKCTDTIAHFAIAKLPKRESVRGLLSRNIQNEKVRGDHRPLYRRESVRGPASILSPLNIQKENVYAGHYRDTFRMEKCTKTIAHFVIVKVYGVQHSFWLQGIFTMRKCTWTCVHFVIAKSSPRNRLEPF